MKKEYILDHPDAFANADKAFEWFKSKYEKRYGSIREHDGMVEIHTGGWSENERLIEKLKKTAWWLLYFRAMQTGGHYYFVVDSQYKWVVQKQII